MYSKYSPTCWALWKFALLSTALYFGFVQTVCAHQWAILIGIDDYIEAKDLKFCGADQLALRDHLVASGFEEERVFLLHSKATNQKYLPFKRNIEKQLELVLGLAERKDVVLLAFSGHGVHIDGKSYLCPADVDWKDEESLVSLDGIYDRLKQCKAAMKLLFVDACRNDPRLGGQRSLEDSSKRFSRSLGEQQAPQGVVLLNSCAPGEVSWEEEEFGHGVFMHFLLKGLSGEADTNNNGKVALAELSDFASRKTSIYVARKFNESQRPFLKAEGDIRALDFGISRSASRDTTNSIGMKLVKIPAGDFMMGCGRTAVAVAQRFSSRATEFEDEYPKHRVVISRGFYMGAHEVTVGQFREFVASADYKVESVRSGRGGWGWNSTRMKFDQTNNPRYSWQYLGWKQGDTHPVLNVTWNDAVAFCSWLSQKEEVTYRLPSEAEWEYACRAGRSTMYHHGDDSEELAQVGNVFDGTARNWFKVDIDWKNISSHDGYVFTSPVGSYKPNALGLYDMHGNAFEWCADWYAKDYYAQSQLRDPVGPKSGSSRVVRGGCWLAPPEKHRSCERGKFPPSTADYYCGFRVVRELE